MRKIKLAEVITRMDWGGSPDIVRIICSYLNPDLYEITLVTGLTRFPSRKTKEFFKKFNQKIAVIPQLKREIDLVSDLSALIRLYLLFRRRRFDIVHTHTAKAGALARCAAFFAGKSIIIHTPHGNNFYGYFGFILSRIIAIIEKFINFFTDKVIVFTEAEKNDLVKFKVAVPEKIRVVYQGLELEQYARQNLDSAKVKEIFNIKSDEDVVGMIGRLEPIKGPEYFVEAAKVVAKQFPKTKFMLVGEGSLQKKIEKQIKVAGLENRFILTGWLEDISEVLAILDILVLPSLNEAVGIVLIEAQSVGIPVIATNVGGIPEVVKDEQTGILVPAQDTYRLACAINYLLAVPQKRLNMGHKAKEWVREKFKAQDMVGEISKLYSELIINNS